MRKDSMRGAATAVLGLALVALGAVEARAALGLRSKFAEVTLEGLKIGQTYSLSDMVNFPLRVMNSGSDPVDLLVQVVTPTSEELKQGYEPVPDANWVHVTQSTFTVPVGLEAVTDVVVTIPNDPALLGRRFQVFLWTQTQNIGTTGLALKGRLLLSVSSIPPSDEELKKKFVSKRFGNLIFSLSPMDAFFNNVPIGKKVSNKDVGAEIKLLNPNSQTTTFRIIPVSVWETSISSIPGWDAAVDPKWLQVKKPIVKAKPDSIQPVEFTVEFPNEGRFKGRRYIFVLRAEILEQDIPAYAYVKVFVQTEK